MSSDDGDGSLSGMTDSETESSVIDETNNPQEQKTSDDSSFVNVENGKQN